MCQRRLSTSLGGGHGTEPCFSLIYLQSANHGYAYQTWFVMQCNHFNRKSKPHKSGGSLTLRKNNWAARLLLDSRHEAQKCRGSCLESWMTVMLPLSNTVPSQLIQPSEGLPTNHAGFSAQSTTGSQAWQPRNQMDWPLSQAFSFFPQPLLRAS